MRAGNFNINDYLDKLYEDAESEGGKVPEKEGLIIPEENKKFFNWLKKDYQKSQVEVKVEMKLGDSNFKPGYDLQTKLDSVKDFKPGMYGDVKTSDTKEEKPKTNVEESDNVIEKAKEKPYTALEKKEEKSESKGEEGLEKKEEKEEKKEEKPETKSEKSNITNKKSVTINLKSKKEDDKK
jgi:hypothetical protein